jgi:acetyltransferase-like isoleucine patch superfamily enzyme
MMKKKLLFKGAGAAEATQSQRTKTQFSVFNLKVVFPKISIGYVRRGSFGFLNRATIFEQGINKVCFDVGAFNDFAICKFVVGGEHFNDQLIHYSFGDNPIVRGFVENLGYEGVKTIGTLKIGHCNVFSSDVLCIGDVTIGNGNTFGAGSLICKDVGNYGIVIGRPAIKFKDRIENSSQYDSIAWDKISFGSLTQIATQKIIEPSKIKAFESDYLADVWLVVRYNKIAKTGGFDLDILGLEYKNRFVELTQLPKSMQDYFTNFGNEEGDVEIDETIQEQFILNVLKIKV